MVSICSKNHCNLSKKPLKRFPEKILKEPLPILRNGKISRTLDLSFNPGDFFDAKKYNEFERSFMTWSFDNNSDDFKIVNYYWKQIIEQNKSGYIMDIRIENTSNTFLQINPRNIAVYYEDTYSKINQLIPNYPFFETTNLYPVNESGRTLDSQIYIDTSDKLDINKIRIIYTDRSIMMRYVKYEFPMDGGEK